MKLTRENMANIAIKTPLIKESLSPLNLFSNFANNFFSSPKTSSKKTCKKKNGSIVMKTNDVFIRIPKSHRRIVSIVSI